MAVDAQVLLAEFTAKLDLGWILEVGYCAMEFLVTEAEQADRLDRCWLN